MAISSRQLPRAVANAGAVLVAGLVVLALVLPQETASSSWIPAASAGNATTDIEAITCFYAAVTEPVGISLTNWDSNPLTADPCLGGVSWEGVTCAADRITRIEIPNKSLTGTLPSCLWALDELERIDLTGSPLTGTFPSEITDLPNLNSIVFENMALSGSLPDDFDKLTGLTRLVVTGNNLDGSLPNSLSACPSLDTIAMADNFFTGILPNTWASLSAVAKIDVSGNDLTGSLPASYGDLGGMIEFRVKGNSFTGTLPSEYADWSSLVTFDVGENNLVGPIPSSYSQWSQMAYFRVNDNGLSGQVPPELASTWPLLKEFHLHNTAGDPNEGTNGFCGSNSANMTFASVFIYPEEIRVPNTCASCCTYEGTVVPPLLCAEYDESYPVICPGDVGTLLKQQLTTLQSHDAEFTANIASNLADIQALEARATAAETALAEHLARLDALTSVQSEHVVCMALQTECTEANMALIRQGQEVVQPDPIEWLLVAVGSLAAVTVLLVLAVRIQAFKRIKKVDGKVKGTVPLFSDEEDTWKNGGSSGENSSDEDSDGEGGKSRRRPSEELVERTLHKLQERMMAQETARRQHMVAVRQRMMAAMSGQPLPPMPSSAQSQGSRKSGASKLRRKSQNSMTLSSKTSKTSRTTKSAAALTAADSEEEDYDESEEEDVESEDGSESEDEDAADNNEGSDSEYSDANSGSDGTWSD